MQPNTFELIGRVNFIEIKYTEKGTCYTRVLVSKKSKKDDEYDTYPITFFGESAEDVSNKIVKDDTGAFKGYLSINKYETNGKKVEKLQLIGLNCAKVKYDTNNKEYVIDNSVSKPEPKAKKVEVTTDAPW